jgi:hypothetical protein
VRLVFDAVPIFLAEVDRWSSVEDSKRLSQIQAAGWVAVSVSVTPTELANSPANFRHALVSHLTQPRLVGGAS